MNAEWPISCVVLQAALLLGLSSPGHGGGFSQVTITDLCFVDKIWKWRGRRELVQLGAPHSFTSSMQASCCMLTQHTEQKEFQKKSSLLVYVSLKHFEEPIYRGVSLTLIIYHTKMAMSSFGKLAFLSCIPSLSLLEVYFTLFFWGFGSSHVLELPFYSLDVEKLLNKRCVRNHANIFKCPEWQKVLKKV